MGLKTAKPRIDLLNAAGIGFLLLSLISVAATTADPVKKQLVSLFAMPNEPPTTNYNTPTPVSTPTKSPTTTPTPTPTKSPTPKPTPTSISGAGGAFSPLQVTPLGPSPTPVAPCHGGCTRDQITLPGQIPGRPGYVYQNGNIAGFYEYPKGSGKYYPVNPNSKGPTTADLNQLAQTINAQRAATFDRNAYETLLILNPTVAKTVTQTLTSQCQIEHPSGIDCTTTSGVAQFLTYEQNMASTLLLHLNSAPGTYTDLQLNSDLARLKLYLDHGIITQTAYDTAAKNLANSLAATNSKPLTVNPPKNIPTPTSGSTGGKTGTLKATPLPTATPFNLTAYINNLVNNVSSQVQNILKPTPTTGSTGTKTPTIKTTPTPINIANIVQVTGGGVSPKLTPTPLHSEFNNNPELQQASNTKQETSSSYQLTTQGIVRVTTSQTIDTKTGQVINAQTVTNLITNTSRHGTPAPSLVDSVVNGVKNILPGGGTTGSKSASTPRPSEGNFFSNLFGMIFNTNQNTVTGTTGTADKLTGPGSNTSNTGSKLGNILNQPQIPAIINNPSASLKDNSASYALNTNSSSLNLNSLPADFVFKNTFTVNFNSQNQAVSITFPYGNGQVTVTDVKTIEKILKNMGGLSRYLPSLEFIKANNMSAQYVSSPNSTDPNSMSVRLVIKNGTISEFNMAQAISSTLKYGPYGSGKSSELLVAYYNTFYVGRTGTPGNYTGIGSVGNSIANTDNRFQDATNDLAYSLAQYLTNPNELKARDPKRYAFINAVYLGYSPSDIVVADKNLAGSDLGTNKIIKNYDTGPQNQTLTGGSWLNLPQTVADNNNKYKSAVEAAAAKYNIPIGIIVGVLQNESGSFANRDSVVSSDGAIGVMQVIPKGGNCNSTSLKDSYQNIDCGTRILRQIFDDPTLGNGNWRDTLALYNTGDWNTLLNTSISSQAGYVYADNVLNSGGVKLQSTSGSTGSQNTSASINNSTTTQVNKDLLESAIVGGNSGVKYSPDFVPQNLVDLNDTITGAKFDVWAPAQMVQEAVDPVQEWVSWVNQQGYTPLIDSAYRSYDTQAAYNASFGNQAASAGGSCHQSGLCFDVHYFINNKTGERVGVCTYPDKPECQINIEAQQKAAELGIAHPYNWDQSHYFVAVAADPNIVPFIEQQQAVIEKQPLTADYIDALNTHLMQDLQNANSIQ